LRSLPRSNSLLLSLNNQPRSPTSYKVFNFSGPRQHHPLALDVAFIVASVIPAGYNVVGYDSIENFPTLYSGFRYTQYDKMYHDVKASKSSSEWSWDTAHGRKSTFDPIVSVLNLVLYMQPHGRKSPRLIRNPLFSHPRGYGHTTQNWVM